MRPTNKNIHSIPLKLLWCVRQTGDDSSPIFSFQEMSCYRKPSSEIWKLGSETCRRTGSLVPRYESLVPRFETLVPKLESLVPKHESLMQLDFTAYKRIVLVIRGAYPWASYHQRNSQTRVLQFLRNNLNGIELHSLISPLFPFVGICITMPFNLTPSCLSFLKFNF